ncbi:MAG: YidC/Oxa1 family membrane protein insertase, partial [Anaerolineales bacterium]
TYPLTAKSLKSTQKMQEMQKSKKWKDMQKKYKDDKQKQQEEQLKLYKEIGFNPLSGCLPTLIQFPIIIGLYQAIIRVMASTPMSTLELSDRLYSFVSSSLIPVNDTFLWMDLGQPERLFLPFFPEFGIPTLAIIVVITSWLSTRTMSTGSSDGQGAQMTQMMGIYMPLLMGWLAYTYASGLALYFVVSNILGVVQNMIMRGIHIRDLIPFRKSEKSKLRKFDG